MQEAVLVCGCFPCPMAEGDQDTMVRITLGQSRADPSMMMVSGHDVFPGGRCDTCPSDDLRDTLSGEQLPCSVS